jgi:hypothetical protein
MLRRVARVGTNVSEELSANVVPSSPILFTQMMEALNSSDTSVLTRATRRDIPDDAILHSPNAVRANGQLFSGRTALVTFAKREQ